MIPGQGKPNMRSLKVLVIFPLMMIGHILGFIFQAFWVGFFSGQSQVNELGDELSADLKDRKQREAVRP